MRLFFLIFILTYNSAKAQFTLLINELGALNSNTVTDFEAQYVDWIELYNFGEEQVCLSNCYISNNQFQNFEFQFGPAPELCIPPQSYLLLFANALAGQNPQYLPFELDADGEYLGLYNPDGQLIHEIYYGTQYADISYGIENGSANWNYFTQPSPGFVNPTSGLLAPLPAPESTINSSYSISQEIETGLFHEFEWVEIRFTLDGSEPGPFSNLYEGPFNLTSPGVLRARAFAEGYLPGKEIIIHLLPPPAANIKSISIVVNPDDFEGNNGINTFIYSGLEKPAHISLFNEAGNVILNQGAGLRIHAPEFRDQQAFRISARSEYGSPVFEGQIFNEGLYMQFQHLVFRCGGNDGIELGGTSLRDPLNHALFSSINSEYAFSNYEPAQIYINGEYWGIYEIIERQDQHYISSRYFETNCDILERSADAIETNTYNSISGSFNDFNALENYAVTEDLSIEDNYDFISTWMDIENFCDYQLLEIYCCNKDWLSNNLKMWRPLDHSRPWEWILWDTDWAYGTMFPADHAYPHWNALDHALSDWGGWTDEVETELLQNLILNQEFQSYFCTRAADLSNSYLKPETILEKFESIKSRIEPEIPRQCERWGNSPDEWQEECEDVSSFILNRKPHFLQHLSERFNLGEIYPLNLQISPPGAGYIEINTIKTNQEFWSGDYFENLEVRLKAVPNQGYQFENWDQFGEENEITVIMLGSQNRIANFSPAPQATELIINELSLNEANLTGQWIELYNPGNNSIALNSIKIADNTGNEMLLPATEIEAFSFFMLAVEPSQLIDDSNVDPSDIAALSFELNAQSGTLYLMDENQHILDLVNYNSDSTWPQCANDLSYTLELKDPGLNNDLGSSWFCDERPYGSPGETNLSSVTQITEEESIRVSVFPNPCRDVIFFQLSDGHSHGNIMLTDYTGKEVLRNSLQIQGNIAPVQIPERLSDGIYFYQVKIGQEYMEGKIMIQR